MLPAQASSPASATPAEQSWHDRRADEALSAHGSSARGLTAAEARARLERLGPNELPRHRGDSALVVFSRQIVQPLILVLVGAAVASAAIGQLIDAGVILAVVVVNAVIGFVQELRAGQAMRAMLELVADECSVLRDGRPRTVPTREVVPGDVLVIAAGEKVAADARVLDAHGLLVDEALLTGESAPVEKLDADGLDPELPLPERHTMLHAGTLVSAGTGRAVVTATAGRTELARISDLVAGAAGVATPLTRRMASFSRTISGAIVGLAVVAFGLAILRGYALADGFLAAVALAVAAIPEGLPAIMTIALAVGVRRMAARNAVIRHLPAVETLGSTTVVCSDKTGTLTRGEMVVVEVFAGVPVTVSGTGYEPDGQFTGPAGEDAAPYMPGVDAVLEAALLCSDAALVRRAGRPAIEGDPTEGALVVAAAKAGLRRRSAVARWPRLDELPFESEHRLMATLHADGTGAAAVPARTIIKGAPEVVVPRCGGAAWGWWEAEAVLAEADAMAARGLRVLAVAERRHRGEAAALDHEGLGHDHRLLGLIGLLDPPREAAIAAVETCARAGVRVVMITGDHPRTAEAVAERLGIETAAGALEGRELGQMDGAALEEAAERSSVFARVAPEHKLRLVTALQRRGEVVAMTGDGVNDAPALKQADIGVAMGMAGTDVSKEAADMVLRDDDFSTIEAAVEEGRRVYDNLVKSIVFVLPTSAGQSLLILGALVLGVSLPLMPVQVLWVNLVTAVALALPLAVEAREPDAMRRPPRRPETPLLDRRVVERIGLVGLMMLGAGIVVHEVELARGAGAEEARTAVAATIILMEVFYLFTCRSLRGRLRDLGLFSNPMIYVGVATVLALQVGFTYLPVMNLIFDTAPIAARDWLLATLGGATVLPVVALQKRWAGRRGRAAATGPRPS
jgi:magnesium-transporting ATPase (P-type)